MARLVLPSRLELKRREGSFSEAPWANVNFTTFLYVSPVQMIPAWDHTGTPRMPFEGFLHFTSSTISGSASLMSARTRASISSRQSPKSLAFASIRCEGRSSPVACFGLLFVLVMGAALFTLVADPRDSHLSAVR